MSNTEKIIKELQNIKESREAKLKSTKPAVRIQQLKNNLIILAHDLFVNKKINEALYRKMQKLTYSRTRETKLNEPYELLNKLKKEVVKKEALHGKQKKITITTYKNKDQEIKNEKQRETKINEYNSRPDKLSSFRKFNTENSISWAGDEPTEEELKLMSEEYLKY